MDNLKKEILNSVSDSLIPNHLSDIKNQYYLNKNKSKSFYKNKLFWVITTPIVTTVSAFTVVVCLLGNIKADDFSFAGKNKAIELSATSILNINDVISSSENMTKGLKLLNYLNKPNFDDKDDDFTKPWEDDWYIPNDEQCGRNQIDFIFETINEFVNTIDMIINNELPTYEIIKSDDLNYSYEIVLNDSYSLLFNEEITEEKYVFDGEINFYNDKLILNGYKLLTEENSPFILSGTYANFDILISNYVGDLFKCDYSFTEKKQLT